MGTFPSREEADGVWSLKQNRRNKRNSDWPAVPRILSISPNSGNTNEGQIVTISLASEGIFSATQYYWTIDHIDTTSSSFYLDTDSGSFNITSNSGSFNVVPKPVFDFTRTTDLTYRIQIREGSVSGDVVYTSGIYTIRPLEVDNANTNWDFSNYSETVITSNRNYFRLYLRNAGGPTGTASDTLSLTFSATYSPSDDAYSSSTSVTTTGYYEGGAVSFNYVPQADLETEGNETLTISISVGGNSIPMTSPSFIITDASTTITPSFTSSSNWTYNEGDNVEFTLQDTANASNVGVITWTINHITTNDADFTQTSSTVVMTNGTANFYLGTIVNDPSEGSETFTVTLTTADGVTIGTTPTITLQNIVPDPTNSWIEISNRNIVTISTSDYGGAYDVSETQVPVTFSGAARVLLAIKITAATTFYNDVCIAGVQILNSSNVVQQTWIFNTTTTPWETYTAQRTGQTTGVADSVTLAAALTYSSITTSTNVGRFSLASGTGSSYTGATDGIATTSNAFPVGDAQIAQSFGTYYIYREASGSSANSTTYARSPVYNFSGGEKIRVAHLLTSPSNSPMDDADTLFLAIA